MKKIYEMIHNFKIDSCLRLLVKGLRHIYTAQANVSGFSRSKTSLAHSITIISSEPMLVMSCVQPGMVSTTSALSPLVNSS